MIRRIAAALAVATSLTTVAARAAEPAPDATAVIPRLLPTVVNIAAIRIDPPKDGKPAHRGHVVGSGVIITPDGEIVTNAHVVLGALQVFVRTHDNLQFTAKVVSRAELADIALLKIEPGHTLAAAEWGDSETVKVGAPVLAIGNPAGLGGTVSSGIVSALHRDIHASPFDNFVQTDAAINHGSSGGPLFDLDGKVIGINSDIYSSADGGSIGLGFAIPSNDVRSVLADLAQFGRIRAGSIGVEYEEITPDIAMALELDNPHGVIVSHVRPKGPAEAGGLAPGDIIVSFNGGSFGDGTLLARTIARSPIDVVNHYGVLRDGKMLTLDIKTVERPQPPAPPPAKVPAIANAPFEDGIRLATVTPALRAKYKLAADRTGVVITHVIPQSLAEQEAFVEGDMITHVARDPVVTPAELIRRIRAARATKRPEVLLLTEGAEGALWRPITINPAPMTP